MKKCYGTGHWFNGIYSRDNSSKKVKNGTYVMNHDHYHDVGTPRVAVYVDNDKVIDFDSFGVEPIPKEIKEFIGNKSVKANIYRIQTYDSVTRGYFCIEFRLFHVK